MEKEKTFLLMELPMRVHSRIIFNMDMAKVSISEVIFIQVNLLKIKLKVMVSIEINLKVLYTKDFGKLIFSMVQVKKLGKMVPIIEDIMKLVRNKGLVNIGSISLGTALVAGRNRVPQPAAGKRHFLIIFLLLSFLLGCYTRQNIILLWALI